MIDTIKLNGVVTMNNNFDGKNVLSLKLTEKSIARLLEQFPADCENYPLNDETGEFKAHSKYDVAVYEQGKPSDLDFSEIGAGTDVCVHVKIASGKYMKKPYKTAYLKAINVLGDVEENIPYNPFEDDTDVDSDAPKENPANK